MLYFGSNRKTLRITASVLARIGSQAYFILGGIIGFVCDPKTKLPAFIKQLHKPSSLNVSDVERNPRVEVHILIPGKSGYWIKSILRSITG